MRKSMSTNYAQNGIIGHNETASEVALPKKAIISSQRGHSAGIFFSTRETFQIESLARFEMDSF